VRSPSAPTPTADAAGIAGTTFEGTLSNEPLFDVGVKLGGQVVVPLAAVVDYLLIRPDGSRTGGYSIEILERRAPKP
jgi:hypothetical protein